MKSRLRAWPVVAAAMLAACAGAGPAVQDAPVTGAAAAGFIEGTASYRERVALPPEAEFEAVLQDVSRADAPAMEIARTTVPHAPMPPIRFRIPYDAAKIEASHRYAVRAVIRVGERLWFTSDAGHPVLTQGAGREVDVLLKRVPARPAADAALHNTYWRILSLAGEPLTVPHGEREPHLVLQSVDGSDSWSATVGCNSMSGAVTASGDRIAFKSGVATLMACPPPLDALEKRLVQALNTSMHWKVEGNRLELRDEAGTQTLLCEAVHLK